MTRYFPPTIGGVQTHVREVALELESRGHEITVITTTPGPSKLDERLSVVRVPDPAPTDGYADLIRAVRKLVRQSDLIHVHSAGGVLTPLAGFITARAGVPSVLSLHGGGIVDLSHRRLPSRTVHQVTRRLSLSLHDQIVSTSAIFTDIASRYCSQEKITEIPNGVDVDFFANERATAAEIEGIPDDVPIILSVNMLKPVKGLHYVIDALPDLHDSHPNTHYVLVGEGGFRKELERRAVQHGIQEYVCFEGAATSREAVRSYLRAADVVAVPSSGESTSIATMEAMAAGCPVVASPAGGLATLLGDGDRGRVANLFRPGSYKRAAPLDLPADKIDSLAKELSWVFSNPSDAREMATKAQAYVREHHDWPVIVDRVEALYENLLSA